MDRSFESFREPGRCLSNRLVQSGASAWHLATNRRRERNDVKQKVGAVLAPDDDWKLGVASRSARERVIRSSKQRSITRQQTHLKNETFNKIYLL